MNVDAAVIVSFDNDTASNPFRRSVVNLATSVSGSVTDPAFNAGAGAAFNLTLASPLTGVNVTTPSAPSFTGSAASSFGAESTGMGVGNSGLGRFDRGESFTLTAAHAVSLDSFLFHEWTGDETLSILWTQGGVAQIGVFSTAAGTGTPPSLVTVTIAGVKADADTPITIINSSPTTANNTGRLRFRNVTFTAVVPEPGSLAALALVGLIGRRRRA